MYYRGLGVTQDYQEAIKWYKKAAEQGNASAQSNLGEMYYEGQGVPRDYQEAIKWYRKAAEQDNAEGQCLLGTAYHRGDGVAQDSNEALKWFKKSAEQGYSYAQLKLGLIYYLGDDVTRDFKEAFKWFRKATEQGNAMAGNYLGNMYAAGLGVAKDYQEAIKWYKKAADQGNAEAQDNLGAMYHEGQGVPQDYKEALKWFRKAAEQGNASAQVRLGAMYNEGRGVPQDDKEAIKWYKKAAEQGNFVAQFALGAMYAGGKGITEDYIEGYKWFILAAAQGFPSAVTLRDSLKEEMTAQQIAEAQRLAKEFKPKNESNDEDIEDMTKPKQGDKVASSGTGFFITSDGFIVTACHVVKDAAKVKLVTNQGIKTAVVVKFDSTNDIAILKAENAQYLSLPIKSSMGVKLGADVFTVGFPNVQLQGFEPKYTKGNISSLSGIQDDPRHFQISTPVQPGNSGGPLIDSTGDVIGIVVAKMGDVEALEATGSIPQNVNYAIKSTFALALLETLPEASQNLKPPLQKERNSADIVDEAQKAVVLILCY